MNSREPAFSALRNGGTGTYWPNGSKIDPKGTSGQGNSIVCGRFKPVTVRLLPDPSRCKHPSFFSGRLIYH
jgi:hypothetical protein